ncbi:MAG: hypothetical protein M1830_002650 [Pleopsidium flavum]|nr:MAG: hypothetical protein M1830_002650 [Pleopsidium flavum]
MDHLEETGDAFAIPDLWKASIYAQRAFDDPDSWSTGLDNFGITVDVHTRLPIKDFDLEFADPFHFGPLETIDTFGESLASSDVGHEEAPVVQDEDIWITEDLLGAEKTKLIYRSWDAFTDTTTKEPCSAYLSEGGPQAFDAALSLDSRNGSRKSAPPNVVQSKAFTMCLLYLGLGRSSIFFRYDEAMETFQPVIPGLKVSGYSIDTMESITGHFIKFGTTMRYLTAFVESTSSRASRPALVSVANAVSVVLRALQAQLSVSGASVKSILQLQSLFDYPSLILECISDVVSTVITTKIDEELLSNLYDKVYQLEHTSSWLREILHELLARISKPWLEFVGEWIGLRRELRFGSKLNGKGKSFVKIEPRASTDDGGLVIHDADYVFDRAKVPAFIMDEEARIIFESGKSLRFLQMHHPQHPLARPEASPNVTAPKLEWKFSWIDVERITARAKEYECNITTAIKAYTNSGQRSEGVVIGENAPSVYVFDLFGKSERDVEGYIAASTAVLDQRLPAADAASEDHLHNLVIQSVVDTQDRTFDDALTFAPPLSLASLLSFGPILSIQARLINSSCIRLFFKEHHLRSHLSLQRRFHMFGDGLFASRFSHALFDPELETAERRQGVARTGAAMGLKLGSRESWPPASSELRLALMGILTESYHSGNEGEHKGGYLAPESDLPGGLSFAVREMSEEELQRCMDPNSVEALDFLRLQYKPPPPLEAIITPRCLYKYDQLFKLLLRVVRMLYVVNQLFRDATDRTSYWQGVDTVAQKFRIEAHHFVSNVSGYFFDVGVGVTWQKFEDKLEEIERRIETDDTEGTLGDTEGLHKLQEYHERVLDRIMFATLLRKRQEQVLQLLEDIFTMILRFARYSRKLASGEKRRPGDDEEVRQMYARFRKRVGVFVSVCRGLSEKKGYGDRKRMNLNDDHGLFGSEDLDEDGENSIGQLLLRLEMTGYYSKSLS